MLIKSCVRILRESPSHGLAAESENEVYHMNITSCVNWGIHGAFGMIFSLPLVFFVFTYLIQLQS